MASKIEQTELDQATKDYAERHGGIGVSVSLKDGKIVCEDANIKEAITGIIMDLRTPAKAMVASNGRKITGMSPIGKPGSSMNAAQAIQTMQAGKDLTYTVQKKAAPNATMALMAASDAKIDLEEMDAILTDEMASSTIRATRKGGRYVEVTVAIRKADFINLLAWKEVQAQETLKNYILDDSDPLNIALPNGFPKIKPDATVTVELKDGMTNRYEKRRAIVHIFLTAMQQWIFQQRQCQTKAKRNATIQMLTSSGNPMEAMDEEELADEAMEAKIVTGA